jgi:hypothetical protein
MARPGAVTKIHDTSKRCFKADIEQLAIIRIPFDIVNRGQGQAFLIGIEIQFQGLHGKHDEESKDKFILNSGFA